MKLILFLFSVLLLLPAGAGSGNVLIAARGMVLNPDGTRRAVQRLNDGSTANDSAETIALPATVEFEWDAPVRVAALRLYSGNTANRNNPSGELAATAYTVHGFSTASGQWRELAARSALPGVSDALRNAPQKFFDIVRFEPLELTALRVTVTGSGDTGKRSSGRSVPKAVILREVELIPDAGAAAPSNHLSGVLQAEFRLPVYRSQQRAELHAVLSEKMRLLPVVLTVRERHTGRETAAGRRVTLHPGLNRIGVDISGWPTGEYRTTLRAADPSGEVAGEFARLLRIDRLAPLAPPKEAEEMSGSKMFFPDDWYLERRENLSIRVVPPEVHRVGRPFLKPDELVQIGNRIGFDADGKLTVGFMAMNRRSEAASKRRLHAVASVERPDVWTVREGDPGELSGVAAGLQRARKESGGSTGFGYAFRTGKKIRFYEPEKDGPVNLRELKVQYTGYRRLDWGVIQPPPQSTWLMWQKGGELLLLQKKPFLQDNISGGEFESPTDSNDNFAGQWLSQDGRTFFYVRGRLLRRYPPFVARYDNLRQIARILTVFSTQDGLNWKQHYYALPDESDPPTAQHYGASIYSVPGGRQLMIAYTMPYSALHQQYHCELAYSWDGGRCWQRLPGHTPWVAPGKPGEWNFGLFVPHNNFAERDGKLYHLVGWSAMFPHFGGELVRNPERMRELNGGTLAARFEGRDLEAWPYFPYFGSPERLADALKTYGMTPGVMISRSDGWFALGAGEKPGSFTTRPVTAGGKLSANAAIRPGGYLAVELTAPDGRPLPGFSRRLVSGDGTELPLFDRLPETEFRIRATLCNTDLYTLNFK
ncbi:MAG: hypothetical protein HPZ91_02670 [Lentisphaeria bacterium]|nr:hypothetical protein [Lentisphaeria bacterium]